MNASKYVLIVDVGTSSVRSIIYNSNAHIISQASLPIKLEMPQPGWVELDPLYLWNQVVVIYRKSLSMGNLAASDISCMGITCQRNTFLTWEKNSGTPLHNFINWKDRRAAELNKSSNNSWLLKILHPIGRILHFFTRRPQFLAAAALAFKTAQVSLRLKWVIQNNEKVAEAIAKKNCLFGNIDTWLLWKFTNGKVFATDYSNASSSGFFDPFLMEWSGLVTRLLGIPMEILPEVKDTSTYYGDVDPGLFGAPIPITALVADQQASIFGQCCFDSGDIKLTMGTGLFLDLNTGSRAHASISGIYPLVGWKIGADVTYLVEGYCADSGNCIEWAKSLGFFTDVAVTSDLAKSVPDCGGAYFVPGFNGLQTPHNNDRACGAFIGLCDTVKRSHLVRAILEAIIFSATLLHLTIEKEAPVACTKICRVDGGISQNEFICQGLASLTGMKILKFPQLEMTARGAAFLSGLSGGVWRDKKQLIELTEVSHIVCPSGQDLPLCERFETWKAAASRVFDWYPSDLSESKSRHSEEGGCS